MVVTNPTIGILTNGRILLIRHLTVVCALGDMVSPSSHPYFFSVQSLAPPIHDIIHWTWGIPLSSHT